jgi:hypothetical protein
LGTSFSNKVIDKSYNRMTNSKSPNHFNSYHNQEDQPKMNLINYKQLAKNIIRPNNILSNFKHSKEDLNNSQIHITNANQNLYDIIKSTKRMDKSFDHNTKKRDYKENLNMSKINDKDIKYEMFDTTFGLKEDRYNESPNIDIQKANLNKESYLSPTIQKNHSNSILNKSNHQINSKNISNRDDIFKNINTSKNNRNLNKSYIATEDQSPKHRDNLTQSVQDKKGTNLNLNRSQRNKSNSLKNEILRETGESGHNKFTASNTHNHSNTQSMNSYDEAKLLNINGKNIESIEELHLRIVLILQNSKSVIKLQENIEPLPENLMQTVSKCEEKDIF